MKDKHTALVLIDIQNDYNCPSWGEPFPKQAEDKMQKLLSEWRRQGMPVVHVRNQSGHQSSTLFPGKSGWRFKDFAAPRQNELVITKHNVSAFEGTELKMQLWSHNINNLVIAGYTADRDVLVTAWTAMELGFKTYVVSDASAAFDSVGYNGKLYPAKDVHKQTVNRLTKSVAVTDTQSIVNMICRTIKPTA